MLKPVGVVSLFIVVALSLRIGSEAVGQVEAPQTVREPSVTISTGQLTPKEYSAGAVGTQDMKPFGPNRWNNDDQLWWTDGKLGDTLTVEFPVAKSGEWIVEIVLTRAPDYGIVRLSLDGTIVSGEIDLYHPTVSPTWPIPLGQHGLTTGPHRLSVKIVGANDKTQGRSLFGIDRILLSKPTAVASDSHQEPSSRMVEQLYQLERLPRLHTGFRTEMFSSYDRTGENNDGFSGAYSKLWVEDGNSVLASMQGPGCLQRMWFTHSQYRSPGLLNQQREHIKVYVDGGQDPVIDVPLEDLFAGVLPAFPKPLVGEGQGGYYCYVPIAYRKGCKVVVEGTGVRFYQITYRSFPAAGEIESFRMDMAADTKAALQRAVQVWTNLGDLPSLGLTRPTRVELPIALEAEHWTTVSLPVGSHMIRAVMLEANDDSLKAAVGAQLKCTWDSLPRASVDLPLEYFFGQALSPRSYRSLLVGKIGSGWYNFMPMPYRESATVSIKAKQAINAKLIVICEPIERWDDRLGYLNAAYREQSPVKEGRCFEFLRRSGRGHYVGTYLVTQGTTDRRLPLWLEGDERFSVDGRLAIHGTGSEDYFNCGWYAVEGRLNGPGGFPVHGFPVYRLVDDQNQAVAYRWHVTDPVYFDKSLVSRNGTRR